MAEPDVDGSLQWALAAARAAAAKTDEPTVVLDVGEVLAITGWFVITGGRNTRQVRALAEEVEEQVVLAGGPKPLRVEGLDAAQWVLLDYGDVIVHVFLDEAREFYDLERLWRDVPSVDWREAADDNEASGS
jgi:ribosome-associated protein